MKRKNIKIIIYVIALTAFIAWIGFKFKVLNEQMYKDESFSLPTTTLLPKEYSSILTDQCLKRMQVDETRNSKARTPVTFLKYNERYYLTILSTLVNPNLSYTKDFKIKKDRVDQTPDYSYISLGISNHYELQYLLRPPDVFVSEINATIADDSLNVVLKNDSLFAASTSTTNFAIRYGKNKPIDMLIATGNFVISNKHRLMIIMLKRERTLYYVFITPINGDDEVPDTLYKDIIRV
jgi:hypothetical protein